MNELDAKKRIEKLKKEIEHHRYLYHVLDRQEISDAALDSLKHELYLLEQQYPKFITMDSPTQRVGGAVLAKFQKVKHQYKMISLEDVFLPAELTDWQKRLQKITLHARLDYFCELKIDGFAISLIYKKGVLHTAATRGDGVYGEDVTANIKTIEAVPLKIETNKDIVEVRGEVFMDKKVFAEVNLQQTQKGGKVFANPRNLAAGSIRQLNPKIAASRKLDFLAYELMTDLGQKTHEDKHKILKNLGFKICSYNEYCPDLQAVFKFHEKILKLRPSLAFEIDGIVVVVNDEKLHDALGVVGKTPRWAVAYKFPAEQTTTIVQDIKVQVGRTGALTPVAHLKPVVVAGSVVSRATLHNVEEIKRLGVKIGDTVVIQKAGDVIPDIVQVLPNLRTGQEKNFIMPKHCPFCHSEIQKKAGEVAYYCLNKNCYAKQLEQFRHFVSKKGFNVEGLGDKIIEQLVNNGLLTNFADIFYLTVQDLTSLPRFGEKSAKKLVEAIQKKKEINLERFLFALGIRHIGEETAILIKKYLVGKVKHIVGPKELWQAGQSLKTEEFEQIEGIGQIIAQSLVQYFNDDQNREILAALDKAGIIFGKLKQSKIKEKFINKKFLMTGSFNNFTRDQVYDHIRQSGGDIISAVSKNLDYLLVGENPGSKLALAKNLGIKTLSEEDFIKMIK